MSFLLRWVQRNAWKCRRDATEGDNEMSPAIGLCYTSATVSATNIWRGFGLPNYVKTVHCRMFTVKRGPKRQPMNNRQFPSYQSDRSLRAPQSSVQCRPFFSILAPRLSSSPCVTAALSRAITAVVDLSVSLRYNIVRSNVAPVIVRWTLIVIFGGKRLTEVIIY